MLKNRLQQNQTYVYHACSYEKEHGQGVRSPLHRVLEQDGPASTAMVLALVAVLDCVPKGLLWWITTKPHRTAYTVL